MSSEILIKKAQEILDTKNLKLKATNIKEGNRIFDVDGTYNGEPTPIMDMTSGITFAKYTKKSVLPDYVIDSNWYEVEDFSNMFRESSIAEIPEIDTQSAINMQSMFYGCAISTIPLLNTKKVKNMSYMFSGCYNLASISAIDTSNVEDMSFMFKDMQSANFLEPPLFNTQNVKNMSNMFYNCRKIETVPQYDTSNVIDISSMFQDCTGLVNVPVFDLSSCTNIRFMFNNCNNLSNESLNNIMASCITASLITSNKTLAQLGMKSAQANTCKTLSNYSAFLEAGWTTGY